MQAQAAYLQDRLNKHERQFMNSDNFLWNDSSVSTVLERSGKVGFAQARFGFRCRFDHIYLPLKCWSDSICTYITTIVLAPQSLLAYTRCTPPILNACLSCHRHIYIIIPCRLEETNSVIPYTVKDKCIDTFERKEEYNKNCTSIANVFMMKQEEKRSYW